ncbi:max-binding protein MNT isoform X2 [Lethenteron reissneri]|uniref:max-binding protein MNT isoform X2 n=1 Tax=Lethenteron reissneri TaxID=7753 RepID=UPI002AB67B26|nr:max-binding protein MNT isoform X2 [Lethenteron reissneri]
MNIDTLLEAARYVEWQDKQGARADKLEISLERDVEGRLSNGDHTPHVYTLVLPTGALLPSAAPPSPSSARRPTNGTCDAHTGGRAHAVSAVTGATAPPSTLHHHGASQSPGGAAVAAAAAAVSPPSASSTADPSKLTPDYKRFAPTQPLSAGTNATPRSGPGGRAAQQQQQQQANVATAGGMMAVTVSPSQPPLAETPAPVNARFANPGRVLLHHHQNHQQQQPTLLLPASTFKEPSLSAGSGSESPGRAFPQAAGPGSASPGQAGVTGQSAQPALLPPMAPSKVAQASADELFPADQKRRPGGRAHLKECFDALKKIIPSMEEKKTSNLTILRGALRYIQVLKRKEKEFEHEMERLAREKISSQQRLADLRNELGESLDSAHIESLLRQAMPRGPTPRPGHSNSRGATAAAAATDDDEDDYAEDDDATSTASEGEENVDDELENSGPVLPSETPSWFQKTASPQNVPSQPLSQSAPMQPFSQNVKVQAFAQSAPWQALPHTAKGPAASQNATVQIFAQHTALQAFPQGAPVQAPSQEPPGQTSQNAALQALAQHATVQTLSPRTTVQVLSQLGSPIQVACHPAPPTAPSSATPRKAPQATSPQPAAAAAPVRQVPAVGPGRHVGTPVPAAQHASVVQVVGGAAPPGSSQQPLRPSKLATVVGAPSQKQHVPTSQNHYHAVTVTTATARAVGPALSHAPMLHRSVAQHVLTLPHALVHDKAGVATTLSLAAAVPQRAVASGQTSVIQAPLGHALHVLRPVNPDAGGKPAPGVGTSLQVTDIRAMSAAGPGSPATSHAVSGSPKAAAPLLIGQTGPLGHVTGAHILIGRPSAAVIHVAQPGVPPQGVIGGVGPRGGPRLTRPRGGAPSSAVTLEAAPKAPTLVHPLPAGAVATTTHIISLPVLIGQGSGAAGQLAAASVLVGRPGSLVEPHVTPAIASALADAHAATANGADAKAPAGDAIPAVEQPEPAAAMTAIETQRNVTPAGRAAPALTPASTSASAAVPVTLPAPSPAPPPALPPHDAEAPK